MPFETLFFCLLGFTLLREIHFMIQIHRLVDKLMCRNLHEYNLAKQIGKKREKAEPVQDEMAEDLGSLQAFL